MRPALLCLLLLFAPLLYAQTAPDSVRHPARTTDTLWVIPAGPVAGSFTPSARLTVEDTVAGWAKIRVEGWVPVGAVLDRLQNPVTAFPAAPAAEEVKAAKAKKDAPQCIATTRKGTRCSRKAFANTRYCWQHQR